MHSHPVHWTAWYCTALVLDNPASPTVYIVGLLPIYPPSFNLLGFPHFTVVACLRIIVADPYSLITPLPLHLLTALISLLVALSLFIVCALTED